MRVIGFRGMGMALLALALLTGAAWGAAISGTVTNISGKSGRIYLSAERNGEGQTGLGVSIAAPGAYVINGVQSGTYTVKAFMDTQGTGVQHANDPVGATAVTVTSGTAAAGAITLYNPATVAVQAPQVAVYPGSGGNFVTWNIDSANGLPIADKYTVSWSTSPIGSPLGGSKDVLSGDKDFFVHVGGASTLYYRVTAVVGATTAASPWTQGSTPSGTGSVTGKVIFTGLTPTGPLMVALVDFSTSPPRFRLTAVTNPTSGGSYTISNVPSGTYGLYAFLDLNGSGAYDVGDVGWNDNDDFNPKVTVAGAPVTAADIDLTADNVNALARIATSHGKNSGNEWYNLDVDVMSMKKQVVNVQITSGPQISGPIDVARDNRDFRTWLNVGRPTVGDTYGMTVFYSDGASETISRSVTGVLDGFASPLAPLGAISYNATPTFSWTAPASAPAEYLYNIEVYYGYGNTVWDASGVPRSQTSILYGSQGNVSQASLTDGAGYNWAITVTDRNGNQARKEVSFTFEGAPAISGTVTNSSGKSGRIYLNISDRLGVSIAAPGSYVINGVQSGTYTVKAFMDTQGAGIQHANDPVGSTTVTVTSGAAVAGVITLTNPTSVAVQAPQITVYPGNGGNMVMWDGPRDDNGLPIADKYTVSWSTSSTGTPVAGSSDVLSGDKDFFAHAGGVATLYYRVTAVVGAGAAASAWTKGTPPSGTGSVTGTVAFTGVTPTGPLYVGLLDLSVAPRKLNLAAVINPTSGGSYTISNIAPGTYTLFSFLDQNNSGYYDVGDIGWDDNDPSSTPTITVSGAPITAPTLDISSNNVDSLTRITTSHGTNASNEWYNLNLNVMSIKKQVVNVRIASGLQISVPIDLARRSHGFETWLNIGRPTVGDVYSIMLSYADGTAETVVRYVTGVIDGFATPLAPVGAVSYNPAPTFSWTAPATAPTEYTYGLEVYDATNSDNSIWYLSGLPSSQTSILYGSQGDVSQASLTAGAAYKWAINVTDRNGNQARKEVNFIFTNSPPTITGFTPSGGPAGAIVTIYGTNFSSTPSANAVAFNGVPATVTAAGPASLTVTVPAGATTGYVFVTTAGGIAYSTQSFIMKNTITASVTGSVGGTVTSTPDGGISCASSNPATSGCTADFVQGSTVTLSATKQNGYNFVGWGGDCASQFTETCVLSLNANKSVTAAFELLRYIKNGANYYSFLQNAFDAAVGGNIIRAQALTFTDTNLIFNKSSARVTLVGGYEASFNTNSGYTILAGKLTIVDGTLVIERLTIE